MKVLVMIFPMWVCCISLFSFVLAAKPETNVSNVCNSSFVVVKEPISRFSAKMEAQSPGMSTMTPVHYFECKMVDFECALCLVDQIMQRGITLEKQFTDYTLASGKIFML